MKLSDYAKNTALVIERRGITIKQDRFLMRNCAVWSDYC
jgi:hypothetical protein